MWAAIFAGITELITQGLKLAADAQTAAAEQHQAILDRVIASKLALAGDKTDAHLAIEMDLKTTQAQLDALKAAHQELEESHLAALAALHAVPVAP